MKKKLKQWLCTTCAAIFVLVTVTIPVQAVNLNPGFIPQSKALELVNLDSGDTVYAKNENLKVPQASTTKIMTFIVASQLIKDPKGTIVTISNDVQAQLPNRSFVTVQLAVGEKISALNLMYCMLIPSGNDAAIALAESASGGNLSQFVQLMNQKAKDLGCANTNYTNVFGKYDKDHYTTVSDLAKIYKYAQTLPLFKQITSTASYTVPATNYTPARKLKTSNKLLDKTSSYYYAPCTTGKTGTSDEAGYCLVSTASKDGVNYLCAALGAPSVKNGKAVVTNGAFEDSRQLYTWAFDSLKKQDILSKSKAVATVPVQQAKDKKQQLSVVPASDYSAMLPTGGTSPTTKVSLPKSIAAPVKKGQKIGTVTVLYNNETLATVSLVASDDVEQYVAFYKTSWFRTAATVVGVAAVIVLAAFLLRALRSRHRRGGGSRKYRGRRSASKNRSRRHTGSYHNYH
ncbi:MULTISPECIES: D-alanyl-D-alanine carboxypeptidase family protein [Caproicibacterium]|uniref:serine-type D-Ala-D-Ala carboxypeptidase n=1 Tax=Caproicibacterium argilliputei TaxID=3030016 RepID=A0AA97H304_9FIRM|nr:D-alanyl-D-alanine carboxypeptidase family protein [Caproicibacterium argilliputei]WOC32717.1 D-alanyl-D-alanine carboxypeptidase family protein [Caproicibacterium argilliputei]